MKEELWNKLYQETEYFIHLQPWDYIDEDALIYIQDYDEYCMIIGNQKEWYGLCVFDGEEGLKDYFSWQKDYDENAVSNYIDFDTTCKWMYLAYLKDVPHDQRIMLNTLNKHYEDRKIPCFLSYEHHLFPWTLNDEEVTKFLNTLTLLNKVLSDYCQQDGQYIDHQEMLSITSNSWNHDVIPSYKEKYIPVEVDKAMLDTYLEYPRTDDCYMIDLVCPNIYVFDEDFDKPLNTIVCCVYDVKEEEMLAGEILQYEDDEISFVINILLQLIEVRDIPSSIYIRNPKVLQALEDICKYLQIDIVSGDFTVIDDIIKDVFNSEEDQEFKELS